MNIFIDSYGCSANTNNAEIMKGVLSKAGHIIVDSEDLADIVIINTCIVKGPTESKMLAKIKSCKKPLIIAGCMPEIPYKELDNYSMIGPRHVKDIVKAVEETAQGNIVRSVGNNFEVKLALPKINNNKYISIVQICEGCLGDCSYCLTKLAKGKLFSYPREQIVKEVDGSVKNGCKEIWLTSQDCGCYGLDNDENLIDLLKDIVKVKGKFKIRLGMTNPNNILPIIDQLIGLYKKNDNLFRFIHIPIQSASDKVLKDMNRKYTKEQFKEIITKIRNEIPDIAIATDIIAGFPTETDADFQETLDLIKEIKPDSVYISKYWPMRQTKAAEMKQLPRDVIEERSRQVHDTFLETNEQKNKQFIGNQYEVFVDDGSKGNWIARDENYRQIIINSQENLLGKFVKVKIEDSGKHDLKAELL